MGGKNSGYVFSMEPSEKISFLPSPNLIFSIDASRSAGAGMCAISCTTPDGKPLPCVQAHSIRETRVRDDRTIDFYMRDGKVYRNDVLVGLAGTVNDWSVRSTGPSCQLDTNK